MVSWNELRTHGRLLVGSVTWVEVFQQLQDLVAGVHDWAVAIVVLLSWVALMVTLAAAFIVYGVLAGLSRIDDAWRSGPSSPGPSFGAPGRQAHPPVYYGPQGP